MSRDASNPIGFHLPIIIWPLTTLGIYLSLVDIAFSLALCFSAYSNWNHILLYSDAHTLYIIFIGTLLTIMTKNITECKVYRFGDCCCTIRRAVSFRNTSQSGSVTCWSGLNGYCWTRQASHIKSARRKLRPLWSAMRFASSGGRVKPSLRHVDCSICTIWEQIKQPTRHIQWYTTMIHIKHWLKHLSPF